MKKLIVITTLSLLTPIFVFAKTINDLRGLIAETLSLMQLLVPLIFGAATIAFIFGITTFIWAGGEEKKREEGKKFIVYGIIGLFVMSSVYGLVAILKNTIFEGSPSPNTYQQDCPPGGTC